MKWGLTAAAFLMVFVIALAIFIGMEGARMEGFCEGRGYDGYQGIDGEFCCYRWEDDNLIAVPIKVLKGE